MRFSVLGWSVPLMALIALAGANCPAEGIVDLGLVGGLADMGDLEGDLELAAGGSWASGEAAEFKSEAKSSGEVTAGIRASVRQSVPTRDRAATYRHAELFRNSKVAVPLLVADLEPQVVAVARPMSGRSVGALPAASWTRPAAAIAIPRTTGREPASWAVSGR
jgi:hypothetical protein